MSFGAHLVHTLASAKQGWIELIFHKPRAIADQQNRKQLAKLLNQTSGVVMYTTVSLMSLIKSGFI